MWNMISDGISGFLSSRSPKRSTSARSPYYGPWTMDLEKCVRACAHTRDQEKNAGYSSFSAYSRRCCCAQRTVHSLLSFLSFFKLSLSLSSFLQNILTSQKLPTILLLTRSSTYITDRPFIISYFESSKKMNIRVNIRYRISYSLD